MEGGSNILPDRPAGRPDSKFSKLLYCFYLFTVYSTDMRSRLLSSTRCMPTAHMLTSSQLIELRLSGVRQDEKYICQHRIHCVGGSSHAALLGMFSVKLAAQKYHLGGLWKFNLANHGRWY